MSDPPEADDVKRERKAVNEHRRRIRLAHGQTVRNVTVHTERLLDLLVRKGYLPDGIEHTREMIDEALTRYVDDEGRKLFVSGHADR